MGVPRTCEVGCLSDKPCRAAAQFMVVGWGRRAGEELYVCGYHASAAHSDGCLEVRRAADGAELVMTEDGDWEVAS